MKAIIMAAGKGTRLQNAEHPCPKVLREANGRALLSYVIDTMPMIKPEDITIVTGFMHEEVEKAYEGKGYNFALQGDAAYGTGYAVMCALDHPNFNGYNGDILIVNGDAPLTKLETIKGIIEQQNNEGNTCTLLSCSTELKLPYGRLIRDEITGNILDIKEEKECSEEEKKIKELNVGVYVFNADSLRRGLKMIDSNNAANEYYLTSVPPKLASVGEKVNAYITYDNDELWGVNTPDDLANVERILKSR